MIAAVALVAAVFAALETPAAPTPAAASKGAGMPMRASGTFEVKISPQGTPDKAAGSSLGRMSIEKTLQGDLEGTSRGEMLTAMTDVEGSAGYVAVERVTGKLRGRSGSFALQHTGTMTRGAQQLTITVVPDSGSGELAGIAGKMSIRIEGGKHFYELEYTLPEKP